MDKIQVRFNESEYAVYHDYCLRYIQAHDAVKRQTLHAFLDLFAKGIIPVGETDIQQARRFLAGKCDALRTGRSTAGGGEPAAHSQLQVCSDLLHLTEDLEKISRIIAKQGIAPNYLMILATFSKIIDESRHTPIPENYKLDRAVIEALAVPLAGLIRANLGSDRNWRSVIHELTAIAARWNKQNPEPKFDLDILLQIGPAVVSHFDDTVKPREILSVLPSYFEEDELEEFEAFLDQKPDLFEDDLNSGISLHALSGPLNAASRAVAAQRERSSRARSDIIDHTSLFSLPGPRSPEPPAAAASPPGQVQAGNKTFEIAVGQDTPSPAEPSSGLVTRPPGPGAGNGRIPLIIGVVAILLLITGLLIVSGNWQILGTGNTTPVTPIINTSTTKPTAVPTAKPATARPTATPNATAPLPTAIPSAKPTLTPTAAVQIYSSTEVGNHLVEIAFGPDNEFIVKPTKILVGLAYAGKYSDDDITQAYTFVNQFNNYSSTTRIASNIELNGASDITLQFMPASGIDQISTDRILYSSRDPASGIYYFVQTEQTDNIHTLTTYVNSDLKGNDRKRWNLRAILYNLGFYGETGKYPDSIFYAGTNNATQLSTIDLKALQLMYGQKIFAGMSKSDLKDMI